MEPPEALEKGPEAQSQSTPTEASKTWRDRRWERKDARLQAKIEETEDHRETRSFRRGAIILSLLGTVMTGTAIYGNSQANERIAEGQKQGDPAIVQVAEKNKDFSTQWGLIGGGLTALGSGLSIGLSKKLKNIKK